MPNRPHPNNRIYAESIRRFYLDQGLSLRKISSLMLRDYGIRIAHTTIVKILRDLGIDTSKSGSGGMRTAVCPCCGRSHKVHRSRYTMSQGRCGPNGPHRPWAHYCDEVCWRVHLEERCKGQQAARRMVEDIIGKLLPPEARCHFVDGNSSNVIRRNIKVYTSTLGHLAEHRRMENGST